jgi:hypothetical protein
MLECLHQDLSFKKAQGTTQRTVYYFQHLWKTTNEDTWSFLLRKSNLTIVSANLLFIVTTFLSDFLLGGDTLLKHVLSVAIGLAALGLVYCVFVAVHLLYSTPRKLLAGKQAQVKALRDAIDARDTEIAVLKRLLANAQVKRREKNKRAAA